MKVIVISFDRWHAGFLGLYGNPWVDTPALDALASESAVFDQHFAENLSPSASQHAWWTGRYQFPLSADQQNREPTWLKRLAEHGIATCLLHDPAATLPVDTQQFTVSRAVALEDAKQLHFEEDAPKFVKSAVQRIQQMARKPALSELFWIHAGGLPVDEYSQAYEELYSDDAPPAAAPAEYESRVPVQSPESETCDEADEELLDDENQSSAEDESTAEASEADEEETEEEMIVFPPRFWRRARSSPRELADASLRGNGWDMPAATTSRQSATSDSQSSAVNWQLRRDLYSGQVTQWDAWVGKIIEAALELGESTPLMIIFTAAAGEHLGEHFELQGPLDLYAESIRVPLIIHVPQTDPFAGRRLALTNAPDLPATILDWFQIHPLGTAAVDGTSLLPLIIDDQPLEREIVFTGSERFGGALTREFYFRHAPEQKFEDEAVFVKPDDRWDADNMLRQLPDAADSLRTRWQSFVNQIRSRADQ